MLATLTGSLDGDELLGWRERHRWEEKVESMSKEEIIDLLNRGKEVSTYFCIGVLAGKYKYLYNMEDLGKDWKSEHPTLSDDIKAGGKDYDRLSAKMDEYSDMLLESLNDLPDDDLFMGDE